MFPEKALPFKSSLCQMFHYKIAGEIPLVTMREKFPLKLSFF
jgi:hypothetical protein